MPRGSIVTIRNSWHRLLDQRLEHRQAVDKGMDEDQRPAPGPVLVIGDPTAGARDGERTVKPVGDHRPGVPIVTPPAQAPARRHPFAPAQVAAQAQQIAKQRQRRDPGPLVRIAGLLRPPAKPPPGQGDRLGQPIARLRLGRRLDQVMRRLLPLLSRLAMIRQRIDHPARAVRPQLFHRAGRRRMQCYAPAPGQAAIRHLTGAAHA